VKKEVQQSTTHNVQFVLQAEQKGTGDAVACSRETWNQENILILYGDTPLITSSLIAELIEVHLTSKAAISFCTTFVIDPTGYGRVLENNGKFEIIEEKNCTPEQRHVNRINTGVYIMNRSFLEQNIDKITKNSLTGEIYFVDLIKMACDQNLRVVQHPVAYDYVRGVNTLQELWEVEQIKRSEFIKHWMSEGVRFELAQSIHIDINVTIGSGSFIGTGAHLMGNTHIGEDSFVGAFSIIENSTIGNNTHIQPHSFIQDSSIGEEVLIGPFARVRGNSHVGNDVQIGNFVEIKATSIGDHSRTKHLSYLGDATIGQNVNIGAGTIICNYDGVKKNRTLIEDNVFIGSNNTLIAPVTIGQGSYTAGGSTINENVPAGSLAIGRSRQQLKEGYAEKIKAELIKKHNCACTSEEIEKKNAQSTDESVAFHGAVKTTNIIDQL
ncbi:UDP-N-acetylglucosamine diphosphorylase/glucosamine-1-phosphate N-acetyltransferase, partial [Candidatus Dependentiae bacterium]|nr:UDP-N-acetylglucosamine diphosphorylase/glucosamine-1-phosphate N-acetyltransferase [Candidatus Dependentiae bacterium]